MRLYRVFTCKPRFWTPSPTPQCDDYPVFYRVKWACPETYLDTEREARMNFLNDPRARTSWKSRLLTHFPYVHKGRLNVSKHFHKYFRSMRISRYTCKMVDNTVCPTLVEIAHLYGKTRVKCTTGRVPSCDYTVFLRVLGKRAHFYRVLPYKMRISINRIFIRVLPCKSQEWPKNGPQNGPQNRAKIF